MIEHLAAIAGHEALHKAFKAWASAKQTNKAQDRLRTAWELIEEIRLSQLFGPKGVFRAIDIAKILEDLRKQDENFIALKKSKPNEFESAMSLIAEFDYELRSDQSRLRGNAGLQIVAMKLRHALEALGLISIEETAKKKRQAKSKP